jgi:hypothetical protein
MRIHDADHSLQVFERYVPQLQLACVTASCRILQLAVTILPIVTEHLVAGFHALSSPCCFRLL